MKKIFILGAFFFLTGCGANYTLVKMEETNIGGIILTPSGTWNTVPTMASPGRVTTWTADGIILNSIMFFPSIKDGVTLIKAKKDEQYPVYKSDMLPNEIMEIVGSTIAKLFHGTITNPGSLKPLKIGEHQGFQFTLEFIGQDNVPRRLFAAGAIKNELLYVILYQATQVYYYDKYLPDVTYMANHMYLN